MHACMLHMHVHQKCICTATYTPVYTLFCLLIVSMGAWELTIVNSGVSKYDTKYNINFCEFLCF